MQTSIRYIGYCINYAEQLFPFPLYHLTGLQELTHLFICSSSSSSGKHIWRRCKSALKCAAHILHFGGWNLQQRVRVVNTFFLLKLISFQSYHSIKYDDYVICSFADRFTIHKAVAMDNYNVLFTRNLSL